MHNNKMTIIPMTKESKEHTIQLVELIRTAIHDFVKQKIEMGEKLHTAVPYLALDVLRSHAADEVVKEMSEKMNIDALPSFETGITA
jgi:hypothetical protein